MKQYRYLVGVLAGIVLIVGAVYVLNRSQPQDGSEIVLETEEQVQVPDTQALPTSTSEIAQNPTEEVLENTPTVTIPPTPRTEMEGTDPSTVNLASGDIQLVEIFAFW